MLPAFKYVGILLPGEGGKATVFSTHLKGSVHSQNHRIKE